MLVGISWPSDCQRLREFFPVFKHLSRLPGTRPCGQTLTSIIPIWLHVMAALDGAPRPVHLTVQDMGVDHRRADMRVAQELSDCPDVVPILEQVGGKRMPQRVGAGWSHNPGSEPGLFHGPLENQLVDVVAAPFGPNNSLNEVDLLLQDLVIKKQQSVQGLVLAGCRFPWKRMYRGIVRGDRLGSREPPAGWALPPPGAPGRIIPTPEAPWRAGRPRS
jgi:hypothetical protein